MGRSWLERCPRPVESQQWGREGWGGTPARTRPRGCDHSPAHRSLGDGADIIVGFPNSPSPHPKPAGALQKRKHRAPKGPGTPPPPSQPLASWCYLVQPPCNSHRGAQCLHPAPSPPRGPWGPPLPASRALGHSLPPLVLPPPGSPTTPDWGRGRCQEVAPQRDETWRGSKGAPRSLPKAAPGILGKKVPHPGAQL